MATTPTKERVLRALEAREGEHISGAQLARELGLSRNSVWKAVNALRREGYRIDAATNRGYALSREFDLLSTAGIRRFLPVGMALSVTVRKRVDSTNAEALRRAMEGAPEGMVIVAEEQTAGRGRRGRPFFSPAGTGIYLSILLLPDLAVERAHLITCAAAVATAEAIEACTGVDASIKWVNDVYCHGKKVAGILTEGSFDLESGVLKHAVVGIGVNVRPPHTGFPAEIAARAGAVLSTPETTNDPSADDELQRTSTLDRDPTEDTSPRNASSRPPAKASDRQREPRTADSATLQHASAVRCRLVAEVVARFWTLYRHACQDDGEASVQLRADLRERYRRRCFLLGQDVMVTCGGDGSRARAVDLDADLRLVVELPDGTRRALSYGEAALACP